VTVFYVNSSFVYIIIPGVVRKVFKKYSIFRAVAVMAGIIILQKAGLQGGLQMLE